MEVDLAPGLPGLQLVGLGDTSGREARERVRSALRNSGFRVPQTRVVVALRLLIYARRGLALISPWPLLF